MAYESQEVERSNR